MPPVHLPSIMIETLAFPQYRSSNLRVWVSEGKHYNTYRRGDSHAYL